MMPGERISEKEEPDFMPYTDDVRTALARNIREGERLRKLLRICEMRDNDDLARPLTQTPEK
jgi:hypothetical protein